MAEFIREVESLLSDESFQRWLFGNAGSAEKDRWNAWLSGNPERQIIYEQALALWKMANFRSAALPEVEQEWQKLRIRLHLPAAKTASIRPLTARRAALHKRHDRLLVWARFGAMAIAASLLLLWLWRALPIQTSPEELAEQIVATDFGQRARINLPDSTIIILNAHSRLRYPAAWSLATARKFELQGEAYFDVASRPEGPQHDFIVHTDDGDIQVVGTRFVVHERGRGTRVVVEEGGVQVSVADSTAAEETPAAKILLNPKQMLQFQKGDSVLQPHVVNLGLYTTWWRDELVLEDTPFEHIIRRLEETYGVKVEVKDKRLLQRTLSGSMENRNLDVITKALAQALRTSVARQGQVVIFGI
ncbi:DUF4974 domain-containing protein [candidate division KSB1 bacterium]|nr:MAG: DUF4974 domain-containing protein [candidate division KSB1 bacterium]MBC6949101.1 DUF4974 domain-containing protein [candidate division KSB1 bacterium]MCE7944470.1 DUF4974 domain-containing protein [Chlorobi bacterium CHB1]MDL1874959.1 DUF4974 domain-containing protein [Cytophagia bacterium CHB2]